MGDFLPLWHFDGDIILYNNGALGVGFELTGKDISVAEPGQINEFSTALENLINTAQEGLKFQIFYRLESDVTPLIHAHESISKGPPSVYDSIAHSRLTYLREGARDGLYFKPRLYFFIRSSPFAYKKQRPFESEVKYRRIARSEYLKHKTDFTRQVTQVESSLSSAGLLPKRVNKEAWFHLLYEYFNLSRSEKLAAPNLRENSLFPQSLCDQIQLTDLFIHKDYLQVGNYLFRTITLKTLPEETHASVIDRLLKLPFHFWLSQSIEILDQKKEYDRLQLKRRLTHSMAAAPGNVSDMESESRLSHIEGLISELLESSERIIASELTLILWATNQEELEEKSDEVLRTFKGMNQSEGIVETFPCFDAFVRSFPGNASGLRPKKMKTSNVAHLMPLYSYWEGNKRPVCLFPNRDNVLLSIDPFEPSLPNWNGLVIGSSGAGKSFTLLQLVLMFYGQTPRPKIVWLDNGASSKNIVDCLDGQFVELNLDSKICLNPFDLEKNAGAPPPSKIKLILAVIENICKEDESFGLPKLEKSLLEECIFKTYARKKNPRLSDFRDVLKEHDRPELRKYAEILFSWTGDTPYGRLLDGPTNIKLEKDLVSIEMRGLDVHPELQNLFLLLLTEYIQREAAASHSQNYLLIVDEAWKLLQSKSGAAFTVEAYRTFRKFNAGIWAISQNINDFKIQEDIANAILQNTPNRIILKQRGVNWDDFKKVLALNDTEIETIKSLKQEKGKYSEFYFLQDENRAIVRVQPDPLSYWICTTDPRDKAKIAEARNNNPKLSHLEVLQTLVASNEAT